MNTGLELITLDNGLRIALDPMPGLATAAVGVWQRVGGRWESPAENGVAHLFEHMAFKGAGARDARAFAEAIEAVGGTMNAATSYERTAYYARSLAEDAPFALDLIADILLAPHWDADELEKEKGVVAQERGEAYDQPDDRVFELHQAALFPDQPLGRPILGEADVLDKVSVATLEAFRDAHMTPGRLVVAVAGAFDRQAFIDKAEARLGALVARAPIPPAPARPAAGAARETRRLEQTHLAFSWPAPAAGDDGVPAARLFSEIFGGGMASRLFQEVREKRGLAYAIDSALDLYEDVGRLMVYAGCEAANAVEVASLVSAELEALAGAGPSEAELARAKAAASAQLLMGLESPAARAEARAGQVFLRGRMVEAAEIRARIAAVTCADIAALAAAALAGPACLAAIGPKAGHGAVDAFHAPS